MRRSYDHRYNLPRSRGNYSTGRPVLSTRSLLRVEGRLGPEVPGREVGTGPTGRFCLRGRGRVGP